MFVSSCSLKSPSPACSCIHWSSLESYCLQKLWLSVCICTSRVYKCVVFICSLLKYFKYETIPNESTAVRCSALSLEHTCMDTAKSWLTCCVFYPFWIDACVVLLVHLSKFKHSESTNHTEFGWQDQNLSLEIHTPNETQNNPPRYRHSQSSVSNRHQTFTNPCTCMLAQQVQEAADISTWIIPTSINND